MPLSSGDKLGPPPAALMGLKPGDKVGDRYQLLSKLGSGGMGEVWKARDTELDRDVALKVSKAEFTARFKREARTIASFNHPNICQIYDVGPNYIVMELIDGIPLRGPLPVEKAVASAGFILDALDAAHRKGFTHRDLKPANVMVTAKGVVKLLDFGLAKQRVRELGPDDETGAALTEEGNITGTLQYMSPEQLEAHRLRTFIFDFEIARHRGGADIEGMRLAGPPVGQHPELGRRTIELRLVAHDDRGAGRGRDGRKFPF